MGIDGIGKRGGANGVQAPAAPSGAQKTGKSFDAELSKTSTAEAVRGSGALEDFKAGRIDHEGYLDQKVHVATAHLEGLPPVDLADLRAMLRDRLASDPGFAELVKQATGKMPTGDGE